MSISVDLLEGLDGRHGYNPRVAYSTAEGLFLASQNGDGSPFTIEQAREIEYSASSPGIVRFCDGRETLLYAEEYGGIQSVARSTHGQPILPTDPTQVPGYRGAVGWCTCGFGWSRCPRGTECMGDTCVDTDNLSAHLAWDQIELGVFSAMSGFFWATETGQAYITLWDTHAPELTRLFLSDFDLWWQAHLALQNWMPGLAAWTAGEGDTVAITQEMVDQANEIWDALAERGSEALASDIAANRALYGGLQEFVGLSFDEWEEAVVNGPMPINTGGEVGDPTDDVGPVDDETDARDAADVPPDAPEGDVGGDLPETGAETGPDPGSDGVGEVTVDEGPNVDSAGTPDGAALDAAAPSGGGEDDSGCGCRSGGAPGLAPLGLAFGLLALGSARVRRGRPSSRERLLESPG